MPNGKLKIEHRVTKLEECTEGIKENLREIKVQVHNHIPSAIRDLDEKVDNLKDTMNKRPTWLMSLIISSLLMLLGIVLGVFGIR